MMQKASFQAAKKPVKTPQARARCGVLAKKTGFFAKDCDQNFGGVSNGV
jgi:hypothetical protein